MFENNLFLRGRCGRKSAGEKKHISGVANVQCAWMQVRGIA